jgi:hypothetical protein
MNRNDELLKRVYKLEDDNKYLSFLVRDLTVERTELIKENQKLTDMLAKATGVQNRRHGKNIDTGIGEISYSISGSIDMQELMEYLEKVIKNNGVKDTIRILAMAV